MSLLPLRLGLGVIFTIHGYLKLFSPSYGPARFARYLDGERLPWPWALAYGIGILELLCGVLILVGFYTRAAATPLAIHVLLALLTVAPKKGFTRLPDVTGWEYEMLLLAGLLTLVLSAPPSRTRSIGI